jgi:CheY-like chemotaxis protein/anti-sigma regulatory factor (Ser/Thr protein kinase)
LADLHRRKDEFLAMLSHELRNPLAPILNAVQLLRLQENEGALQQEARTIIERQVGQLTRLIDDLLEVSRITTGRIHLHQERVLLNGIVTNAVETVGPLIGRLRHSLNISSSPQPILVYGDAARLEQVVVNLLTNAAKYTDEGGNIWLSLEQEGDEAVLRVRDTGVGIAPELLPRIFDLFTQAERSLDRSQGGLGIGLCLVQRLVEMHRGRVEAVSSLGKGSEFVVRLPVLLTVAALPLPLTEKPRPSGPSLRVLVVDAALSLVMLLKASGHDVSTAHDGQAALESAIKFHPNLILLDIGLPGTNGYEVAKKLRQQHDLQSIVLVAMTGYGQEADRERSHEAGFDHHLVKPAEFSKVQEILATVSKKVS